jgi:hypothetical protein
MRVVLVAGALANKLGNGGGTWERMSWVVGLRRLGFDVYFVEQIARESCVDSAGAVTSFADSVNLAWFKAVTEWFAVADRSALIYVGGEKGVGYLLSERPGGEKGVGYLLSERPEGCCAQKVPDPFFAADPFFECAGVSWPQLLELAESAELLVNLSGHLTLSPLLDRIRRKAYIDVDPGFTQFWHADPSTRFRVDGHDFYFTIGENIGSPDCPIPTSGLRWRPIRQPVVLDQWPVAKSESVARSRRERTGRAWLGENATLGESHLQNPTLGQHATLGESHLQNPTLGQHTTLGESRLHFTTIASWRGVFGPVQAGGKTYGLKVHEFRKILELPGRVPCGFEIALNIYPGDHKDLDSLKAQGWRITDPLEAASTPDRFRQYVQQSGAEFSVAQGIYVQTNSGWFSDRTTRYLASGRPVLVQDTGLARHYPVGQGLLTFRTLDEAVRGAEAIAADYEVHCRAARDIAERYFDSDKVLSRMLEEIGIAP